MNMEKVELGKLYFEEGIPGFVNLQFFRLLSEDANSPFYVLQSYEQEEQVEFWAVDPFMFFQDYEFTLPQQAKEQLRITEDTAIAVVNVVTVRPNGQVTVNLKAPIIINRENRMAKQVILNDEKYELRKPLFQLPVTATSE
ncbi:flagellar assembly protein FliW [Brevibacillus ginsengisoli]|uniref:flagellar assembly protein FliW n=1 Tax=Brevibacillus ginsengisoli TaxID=363854 RepID=UPI003CEC4FCB